MKFLKSLFLLILLMRLSSISAQDLSTYFLDSLKFIVNKDTIVNSGQTKVYFFKNTRDTQIVVFKSMLYKVVIKFKFYDKGTYLVQGGWPELYKNDKKLGLGHHGFNYDTNICDMRIEKVILKNSSYMDSLQDRYFLKVNYRYTFLAPKDTNNYKYNYRQGEWWGRYKVTKKVLNATVQLDYNNDLKNGVVKMLWSDGGIFSVQYDNGKKIGEGQFNLDSVKKKRFRKRLIPEIVYVECDK